MRHPGPPRRDESKRIEDEIEVSVGNVRLQIDVETIYLAMRLVKMLQQLFGDQHSVDTQKNPPKEAKTPQKDVDSKSQDWAFKFSMDTFQIALLKELTVQSIPANKPVGALRHAEWGDMSDVLLHLHIRNISAAGFKREDSSKITLKLGVFAFGFNDRTVLSFHPDTGLEETTVDLSDSQDDDVSITYSEDNGGPRIGISTLPVNVFLDVQKLDDTFASYGGFSGVLKIGNHIKSTCDLSDLLSLITPTDFKYEADDDILIDTLLSQRRKGSLIKVSVQKSLRLSISDLESLKELESLGKDVAKLSSVAKLLPDDERPGILSMLDLATCNVDVMVNERIGKVAVECSKVRVAHIGLPALLALEIGQIFAQRNDAEMILDMVNVINDREVVIPTIMARWLGDEMEPTLKVKLFNLLFDYRVKTIMDVLGLSENSTSEETVICCQ
ncbi:Autophagy-related protein [Neofusicoccum parvum]|nr:Autophagy-related protein [Neofusicoccum parvum]